MTDPKFIGPPKKLFQSYTMPKAKTATEIGKDIMKKTNVGAGNSFDCIRITYTNY